MKLKFSILLLSLNLGLQAQFNPYEQFFFNTLWPVPDHDSISIWQKPAATPLLIGSYNYEYNNGLLDSLYYYDNLLNGNVEYYSGKAIGNKNVVVRFLEVNGKSLPMERMIFIYDINNRVEEIDVALHNGNYFEDVAKIRVFHNPDNKVQGLIYSEITSNGGNLISEHNYHYTKTRLDSVNIYYSNSFPPKKYIPRYDHTGKMIGTELYEELNRKGDLEVSRRYIFGYANSAIQEIREFHYDLKKSEFFLKQIFEYSTRPSNTVGLKNEMRIDLQIYPNPVSEYLYVKTRKNFNQYTLYSSQGTKVLSGVLKDYIDVSQVPTGTYILRLNDIKGRSLSCKVLVKR